MRATHEGSLNFLYWQDGLCLYPAQDLSSLGLLRFLMEQHKLPQSRLPEIGTLGVVSEILSSKHDFNVHQIKALSEQFKVPPSVFI